MGVLDRAEIWSDVEAAGGVRLLAIPGQQILRATLNSDLKGRADIRMMLDHAIAVRSASRQASLGSLILTSAPGPLFRDQFQRPDSNTVGGGWTEVEAAAANNRILSNALRQLFGAPRTAVVQAVTGHPSDFIIQVTRQVPSTDNDSDLVAARGFDRVAAGPTSSQYASQPNASLNLARIIRLDNGTTTIIASTTVVQAANEFWQNRLVGRAEGSDLRLKNYFTKVTSLTDLSTTPALVLSVLDLAVDVPPNLSDEIELSTAAASAAKDEMFLVPADVLVDGLPTGFSARVDGGTAVVEVGGTATVPLDGNILPFTRIEVLDGVDVVGSRTPVGGGWGGETYTFTLAVDPFTRGDENRVLRSVFNPSGVLESRITVPIETRAADGGETTRIEAQSILVDLANAIVQRTESDGSFNATFTLLSLTLNELVDFILTTAPAQFAKGTIDTPTLVIEAFTFDFDTPLSALQELAQLAGLELAVRRNAAIDFKVDIVVQAGLIAGADTPQFRLRKNIVGIERRSDARDQANRIYPFGQRIDSTIRQTVGKARWIVATVPSATTFTVTERLLFEDQHLIGNFVDDLGGGLFEIVDTVESTGVVTTISAHGLSVAQVIAFRLNSSGDELPFVESPSSQALYGVLNGRLEETDIPPVDNLVVNPALRDFTAGTADSFTAIGSPTLTEETLAIHTRVGGSSQKVETLLAGEGIKTAAIPISAVAPNLFFSALVQLFVETGGGVEIFLDHSTEGRFPLEGSDERAFTTKAGVFIEIRIEGKEFPTGSIEVVIISRSAGTNVFYVDAVQFVQAASAFEFFEGRSSVILWQRGLDQLTVVSLPEIQYALPGALDLNTVRESDFPFDEVALGGNVFVRDERFEITTLTRVLQVRQDLKAGKNIGLELSSRRQNIIDRLSAIERRKRIDEPEGPPAPQVGSFVLTLPASEVAIALTAKGATLSYKFLATTGTAPTYDDVLATGTTSDEINGEQVLTGLTLAPNETASVRIVAFSLIGGGGTPGETAAATISRVPEQVLSAAATVASTVDELIPANTSEVIFWDDETEPPDGLIDVGEMHPPNASQEQRLIVPPGAGGVYLILGQAHVQAATTGAFSLATKHIPAGEVLGLEPFFVNNPRPEGEIALNGWGMSLFTGFASLVAGVGDFFRYEAATTVVARTLDDVDSRFSAVFLSAQSRLNPRVYLRRTSGQSIATGGGGDLLAWQAEVDDVGGLADLGTNANRITIPAAGDGGYLFISVINWSGSSTTAERRIQIEINGSEAARVRIERTAGNAFSGAIQQQVAYMRLAAVATDFFTVRAFQDSGGALLVNIGLTYFEAYKLFPSSDVTTPRADIARTANLSIPTATATPVPWNLETVDVGGMHSTVSLTERIVIPVGFDGSYIFIAEIDWAAQGGGLREVIIRKNGIDTIGRELYQSPDTDIEQQCFAIDNTAAAGDFYEVVVRQTSGVAVNILLARSKFQASKITQLTAGG